MSGHIHQRLSVQVNAFVASAAVPSGTRSSVTLAASLAASPPAAPAPDDAVATRDELARALRTLAPRQRTALVLRYGLDLSEGDVARRMGVSAMTVKSTTSRALSSLGDVVGCCPEAA